MPPTQKNMGRGSKTVTRKQTHADHERAVHDHDDVKNGGTEVLSQLSRLESENLIRPLSDEMDPAYIFKHTLTQETAYDAMLKTKRAELHRRVAEAIEKLSPDQLDQNAAVLALHYERGGWDDLAFVYAALAGDVAWRAYAHREALAHYDSAIEIAQRVDAMLFAPRVREVFAKRGRVFEVIENRAAAIDNYNAMVAFAQRAGDAAMEAEALNHLVTVQGLMMGAATPEIDAQLDRALKLAQQIKDPHLIGRTYWNMGLIRRFSDPMHATEYFKQSLELARSANLKELAAYSLTELTVQGQVVGQWRAAEEYARQALEEFRALDNKPMIVDSLANLAELKQLRGQTARAWELAEEGVRISSTIENPWGILFNQTVLLTLAVDAGEFERALLEGDKCLKEAQRIGFPPFIGLVLAELARVNIELDRLEKADQLADECVGAFEKLGVALWTGLAKGCKAWVQVRLGRFEEARAILDPMSQTGRESANLFSFSTAGPAIGELALADGRYDFGVAFCSWLINLLAAEDGLRVLADVLYGRGRLYHARGDFELAEQDCKRAREYAEQSQYKLLLWQIDAALAKIYASGNKANQALEAQQRAAKGIRDLADKLTTSALRGSFLARKDVDAALRG